MSYIVGEIMDRFSVAKKVGIIGIIGNAFLFIIKIIVALISRSQSMLADSINSAGDIFASFMTWIGNKISSVPNDEDHNFGHGKAEYLFSMFISISMMLIAIKLLYDSVLSIVLSNKLTFSWALIVVCLITVIIKFALFIYTKKIYEETENLLVKANMEDHRNDCVITFFTTVAVVLTKYNIYWVDGVVGIGISIWIFIAGLQLFRDSYNVLMDSSIDNKSKDVILSLIKSYSEIKRVGTLYSIPIGCKYVVVVTVYVNGKMATTKSHRVADKLEKRIITEIDKVEKVIVHVEPFIK